MADPRSNARMTIEAAMSRSGYNINQLYDHALKSIGTQLSKQTYYRVFDPKFTGNISVTVFIEVAHVAGCSNSDIVTMARSLGDRLWSQLIDTGGTTPASKALVNLARDITSADPSLLASLTDTLALLCKAAGINREHDLEALKGGAHGRL